MKKALGALALVGFVVALMVAARWSAGREGAAPGGRSPFALAEPHALPALSVVRDGKALPLAGARARPMLLHLWASWCGPCRAELPALLAFGRRGPLELVAVSVDDDFASVRAFFNDQLPPEVAWDEKITLEAALGVQSLPTTFVVDARGVVRMRFDGMQRWEDPSLARAIDAELGLAR